jgi:hypothetical protein
MMTNEETKARQQLRDARGNKRYIQPEPIKVLDARILERVNKLPNAERIKFMRSLQIIETMPLEMKRKAMVELLNSIFISSE